MQQKVRINLSPGKFREIIRVGYSLDYLFLLMLSEKGLNINELTEPKEKAILQALHRKMLVNETGNILPCGKELLESLRNDNGTPLVLSQKAESSDFDEWWNRYPATDRVIINGKLLFKGSRSLKIRKDDCRVIYNKILDTKEYSHKQMMAALGYEVEAKIERSLKEKKNILSYMKGTYPYLFQRAFESFITEEDKEPAPSREYDQSDGSFTI